MTKHIKVVAVHGQVLQQNSSSAKQTPVKNGGKLALGGKLFLTESSNIVVKLPDGRVVEILGKDLVNQGGVFDLGVLGQAVQPLSDLEKLENFASTYKNITTDENHGEIIRLEDGRVFQKQGKDYVEIAGDAFEDPQGGSGGHRFVQVVRMGENSVADGISPLMLNRISNAPSSMGLEFPSSTSSYRPQEHTMGGGSWKGLGVVTPPVAAVNSVVKYEGQYLVHTVTVSKKNSSPYDVIVTVTESGKGIGHATLGVDTGIIEYSIDGGTTWQVANPSTDGSFAVELPSNHTSFLVRVPSTVDSIYEGKETYNITAHTEYQREILPEGHGTGTILDGGEHPDNPSKQGEPKVPTNPPTNPNDPTDPSYYDDDRPVAVVTSDAVYEGQHLIHKVTLSNDSVTNTGVNVKLVDGTAELSTDTTSKVYIRYPNDNTWTEITSFNPDGSFNVTVEPGKHLEGFEVKVESTKDTQYEGKEQYAIEVKTEYQDRPLVNGGTGIGTIVDDGSLPKNPSKPGTPEDPEKPIDPNEPKIPRTPPSDPSLPPNDPNYHDDDRPYATVDSDKVYEGDPLVHNVKLSNDSKYDTIVTVKLEKDTADVSGTNTDIGTVYVRFKDGNGDWKPWEPKSVHPDGTFDVTVKPGKEHIDGFQVRVDSKEDTIYEGPEVYNISVKTQYQEVPVTNGGTGTGTIVDDGSPLINDLDSNPSKEDPKYPNDPNRPIDPNEPKVPNIPTKFHDDDRPVAFVNNDAQYEGDYLYHAIKVSNDSTTTTTVNVLLKDGIGSNGAELLTDLANNTTNPTVWVRLPGGTWIPVTFKSDGSFDVDLNGTIQHTQGFEIRVESTKDAVYEGKEYYTVEVKTQHQATPLNNGETVKVHGVDTVVNGIGIGTIVDDGSLPKNPSKPGTPEDPEKPVDPNSPKVPTNDPNDPLLPPGTPNYHDDDRPVAFVSNDAVYEGEKLVHLVQVSNDSKYQTSVNVKLTDDKGATADLTEDLTGKIWVRLTDANGDFILGSETLITSFNPDGSFNVSLTGTHDHVYGFQVIVESKGDTRYEGPEFYNIEVKTQHQDAPLTNGVTIDVHGTPTTVNGIGKGTIVDDGSRLPNDPKDVSPTTDNPTIPADPLDPNRPIDPNNPRLPNDPNQPHDDDRPVAYVTDDAVYEGDKLYHTIKVSNDSTTTTTVNVLLKDGTAEILTDLAKTGTNPIVEYTLDGTTWIAVTSFNPDGSFDVPLNGTAQHTNGFQIRVTSKVDSVLENTEQYTVEVKTQHQDTPLTNGTPVSIHGAPATPINGTGTGTIVDDGSALPPVNGQTTNPKDNPTVPADPLDPNRPIDPNDPRLPNDPNKAHDDDRPVAFVSSDAVHEGAYLYHDVKVTNDVKDPAATPTTVTVTLKDGNLATDGADLSSDLSNDPSYPAIEYSFDGVTWTTVTPNVTGTDLSFNVTLDSSSKHLNGFQVRVKSSVDSVYEGKEQYTIEVQTQYQDAPLAPNTSIEVHGVPSVVNGTGTGTIVDDGSLSPNPSTVDPADPNDPNRPIDPNNPKQPFDPNDPAAHDPEDPKYHDDDRPVAFVTSDAVYEGETLSHWVQLSNDIKQGTTQVTVTLSNGTATLFTDPTKPVADVDVPNVSIGWVDAAGNVIGALVPVTVLPNGTFIVNVPQGQHLDGFKVFIDSTVDQIHEGSEVYNISVVTEYQDNPLAANTTLDIGGTPTVVNGSGTGTIVDDGSLAPNPSTVDPADPANPIRPINPTTPKDPIDPLQPHDDDRPIATITGGEMAEAVYDPITGAAVIDPLTGLPEVRYIVHTVEVSNHSTTPTTVYIGLSNATATLGTDTTTIEYRVLAADGLTWGAWTTALVAQTGGEFALPQIPAYDYANPPATLPKFQVRVKVEADALDTELAEDYIITARTQHQSHATDNGNTAQDHTSANNDGTAHGRIHNAQTNITNGAVSEEDLVGGSANATATNNAVTSGAGAATGILVRATDNIHHVIIGDNSNPLANTKYANLTLAQLQALSPMNTVTIDTDEGTLVLNGYTPINGSEEGRISYTYTLKDPLTHTQPTNDTTLTDEIPVRVYGGNGDPSHPTTPGSYDPYGKLVITITDDVPQVGTGPGTTTVTVDETDFVAGQVSTTVNGFGATVISTIYGADGPATSDALVYSLSLGTVTDSGLKDTATGRDIWLYMDGYDIVGRVAAVGNIPSPTGDEAFRISITDAGDVTLTQKRPMDHQTDGSSAAAHDDALSMLANRVVLNVTVTDKDGDTATDSKNIGDKFIFKDDGPTITAQAPSKTLEVSDEDFAVNDTQSFADAFTGIDYGTDGAAASNALVYGLTVSAQGVDSGLDDVLTGQNIYLYQVGNVVYGHLGTISGFDPATFDPSTLAPNSLAFTVTVNTGNANVTLDQIRAIEHDAPDGNPNGPDEVLAVATSAIAITATVTDRDGDTATASRNIGDRLTFLDDVPDVTAGTMPGNLIVDESALPTHAQTPTDPDGAGPLPPYGTSATVDFSGAFNTTDYGNDGQAVSPLLYALGVSAVGADSGLRDTLTPPGAGGDDDKIYLYLNGGIVYGQVGNATGTYNPSGTNAFTVSVAADGKVTLTQIRSIEHDLTGTTASPANYDDSKTLSAANLVALTATATDKDGDQDTHTLNIGQKLVFRDDAPVVTTNTVSTALEVDETVLTTDDSENFASAFSVNYGADGAGSTAYSLGVKATGVDSGVVDTATGQRVYLYLEGGIVVGRVGVGGSASSTGLKAFEIRVDSATAEVGLDQIRSLVHPTGGATSPNELITLTTDTVTLTATATDKDGDVHSAFINLGDKVGFRDDAPTITAGSTLGIIAVDESALATGALPATDPDGMGPFNAAATNKLQGFATNAFTTNYGADGAGSIVKTLQVSTTGVSSGLRDTETGNLIYLYKEANDVVGRVGNVSSANSAGAEAFRIALSGDDVTLTQSRSIRHANPADPDELATPATIANAAIRLQGVIADKDGDTATHSINIGDRFKFLDDGPTFTSSTTAILDERYLPLGSNPNPLELTKTGTLNLNFGADKNSGSVADVKFTQATIDNLENNWDNIVANGGTGPANNENLVFVLSVDGHTITATDGAGGATVFTIVLDNINPWAYTAGYTFTLSKALEHNSLSSINIPFNSLSIIDGDGDTTVGNIVVTVIDDAPDTSIPVNVIVYEDLYIPPSGTVYSNTFNTNADATAANTAINGPLVANNTQVSVNGGAAFDIVSAAEALAGVKAYETEYGYAKVNANGTITYYPKEDFSGTDSFTYTTTTDDGTPKTYHVNVNVLPVSNDKPVFAGGTVEVVEDHTIALGLTAPTIKDNTDHDVTGITGIVTNVDNPERLGAITLTLSGAGAAANLANTNTGAVLTKGNGGALVKVGSTYSFVIVDGMGNVDYNYHHAGIVTGDANINYVTVAEYEAILAVPGAHRHENFAVAIQNTSYEVYPAGHAQAGQIRTDVWGSGTTNSPSNSDDVLGQGATRIETIQVNVQAATDDAYLDFTSGTLTDLGGGVYQGTTTQRTGNIENSTAPNKANYQVVYANLDPTHDPNAVLNPTATVTMYEDRILNLADILQAGFADVDGSEVRSITISNPAGNATISISYNGATAVTIAGGASRTFTIANQQDADSFEKFTIYTPTNFSGEVHGISITINARDVDSDGWAGANVGANGIAEADRPIPTDTINNNTVILNLNIRPGAGDLAALTATTTAEDTPVAFLAKVAVTDTTGGNEVINSVGFTVPTDWKLLDPTGYTLHGGYAATNTGSGWWIDGTGNIAAGTGAFTIHFNNGTGTVLTEAQREAVLDLFHLQPPAHSSEDLAGANRIALTVETTDTNVTGSDTVTSTLYQAITVTAVAEGLELTGNVTIIGSTTDYYLNAADNPVNWTAMNTDAAAANTNGDTSAHPNAQPGTADLTMNGNFRYTTHAFEDTWFDLATNGFDFKSPWYNEDGVGSGAGHGNQEQTSAVLNAYVVVRDAGGVITGLTLLTNASFQYKNAGGTVVASGTNGIAVPVANLDKVEFQSPNGFSGEVWIKVQAQTIDTDANGGTTAPVDSGVAWLKNVIVEPLPDAVTLQVKQRIVMDEDTSQKLYIRTQTSDQDGSETFNVEIRGIPTGGKLEFNGHVYDTADAGSWASGGHTLTNNGDGTFTLRLNNLSQGVIEPIYTPPLHSNTNGVDTTFTVYAESVDHLYINGQPPIDTAPLPISSNQTIKISVIGVPDAPILNITDKQRWIENNLDEHDGGVNTASAGGANLVDLSNFINPVTGIVHGESTYPTDSSETITLRITNMPADFDLVDAAGGPIITLGGGNGASRVWVLTTADLATAKIKLPVNYSGTVKFDVAPVVTENDGRATIFAKQNIEFYVTPSPEATLHLTSDVWEDVDNGTYGHNGELGRIDLIANTTVNGDTINETIYAVRFSKADLDAKGVTLYSDAAGTTPLVEVGGYYTVTGVTNVQSIYVRGPANFSGNIPISVDYIVADSTNDGTLGVNQTIYTGGGTSADWVSPTGHQTINHTLNFRPVTDDVDLTIPSITSTGTVVGNHATLTTSGSVTVNLGITKLPDANAGNAIDHDSSEHMNYLLITGVPDGVAVVGGVLTGDGQWIYPNTSSFGGALTDSIHFSVSNYADSLTSHPITITAVTQDGAARIKEDSETWLLTTTYGPGGPATILPKIELTPLHPDEVEDTNFALSHAVSAVIDFTGVNNGSAPYDMTITVRMPADDTTVFSGMNYIIVTEGSVPVKLWTKTVSVTNATAQSVLDAELANIMTDPDNHANSNAHNQGGQHMYPLDITVAFYSGGATSEDRVTSNVDLAPVTDPATLAIDATATDEGGIVPITINVTSTGGADENGDWTIVDGKLYLQVANGVDAVIAGQLQDSLGNPLATETDPAGLPAGTYYVLNGVAPNTPIQLQYAIDHDGTAEYQHGSFQLNGWVINQENGSTPLLSNGSDNIVINQVNTPPAVTVVAIDSEHNGTGANAVGSVELNITLTIANGTDPHEKLYSAFIKDLPSGFTVYVGATEATATLANNAGEGVWSIPTPGGVLPAYVSIKPPAYWSGTLDDLKLVLMSGEVSPATATEVNFDLVVTPVADGIADFKPTYSFNQTGNPLTTLNLNIGMRDSERVNNVAYDEYAELTRLQLTGIPDGLNTVFLANGAMIDPGRISLSGSTLTIIGLTQNELDNLQILHSPTAGKISITAAAQTYEVDASGAEVHTSGWTSAASAFDLQVTGTAPWNGTSGNDTRTGTAGNDILNGLAGNDTLNGGNGHDILNGGDGDDTLNGGAGNDYLIGGNGNDILNGDAGNDMLMGGAGNDTLNGGADNDILQGGAGSDSLTGGTGADTFVWGSNDIGLFATPDTDTITDFNWGQIDKIDATALLTALGWNGNDATLSQFVSASGTTIKIHDVAHTKGVDIVVTGQNFADLADMISKTNFQH